ncbi:MAG: tetratricopeptide repeat protein [Bacteroidales bacterium]|jgi:tetratricopeptide (TPR) repeat protein|nr:tetratricopeptide repeat protein [Bacteroidales bacterium]
MKKSVLIIVLVTIFGMGYAQVRELRNAYNHYINQYWDRAKSAIDKAAENDETKNDAKTWLYRGNIYLQLGYAQMNPKKKEYHGLCTNCGEIAYDSYMKALQIDRKVEEPSMGIADPLKGLTFCTDLLYNEAVKQLQNDSIDQAFVIAEKAYNSNKNNEGAMYIYALTAEYANKKDIAKARYNDMIKRKTKMDEPYIKLAAIYQEENDTLNAIRVVNQRPEDDTINVSFVINKSVILMWAGQTDEATEVMNKALEKDSNNHLLLFGLGSAFLNQKKYDEAEKYLMKALQVKPDDINTIYNLGNNYYNHYADIYNAMDKIDYNDVAAYEKAQKESQVLLRKALPLLEKAYELDPEDRNTLIMLKNIYPRIEKTEEEVESFALKLKEINAKLENK